MASKCIINSFDNRLYFELEGENSIYDQLGDVYSFDDKGSDFPSLNDVSMNVTSPICSRANVITVSQSTKTVPRSYNAGMNVTNDTKKSKIFFDEDLFIEEDTLSTPDLFKNLDTKVQMLVR